MHYCLANTPPGPNLDIPNPTGGSSTERSSRRLKRALRSENTKLQASILRDPSHRRVYAMIAAKQRRKECQ